MTSWSTVGTLCVLLLVALAGCPHPPNPQPTPPDQYSLDMLAPGVPTCPTSVGATPGGVCDGMFTAEGLACVACTGGMGCVDRVDVVYCVAAGSCSDARCHLATTPSDGGAASSKHQLVKPKVKH